LIALIAAPVAACPFHGSGSWRFSAFGGLGNMPAPDFEDPFSSTPVTTQATTLIPLGSQTFSVSNPPVDNATLVKLGAQPTQNEKAKSATTSDPALLTPKKT